MPIRVIYECSGCHDAKAEGRRFARQHFDSFNGKGYGFGRYRTDRVDDEEIVPDGWVAFCPVGATYCPKCWAEITKEVEVAQPARIDALAGGAKK